MYQSISAVQKGNFRGGMNATFSLRNKGVGYGKVSKKVSKKIIAQVETLKKQIISGKVKVPAKL